MSGVGDGSPHVMFANYCSHGRRIVARRIEMTTKSPTVGRGSDQVRDTWAHDAARRRGVTTPAFEQTRFPNSQGVSRFQEEDLPPDNFFNEAVLIHAHLPFHWLTDRPQFPSGYKRHVCAKAIRVEMELGNRAVGRAQNPRSSTFGPRSIPLPVCLPSLTEFQAVLQPTITNYCVSKKGGKPTT